MNDNFSIELSDREKAREEAHLLKLMDHGGIVAREFLKLEEEVELWKKEAHGNFEVSLLISGLYLFSLFLLGCLMRLF